jgi:hypothetical protein
MSTPERQTVWIVYATLESGERFALAAYAKRDDGDEHIRRCRKPIHDDGRGTVGQSPAEVLGIVALTVSPLEVRK